MLYYQFDEITSPVIYYFSGGFLKYERRKKRKRKQTGQFPDRSRLSGSISLVLYHHGMNQAQGFDHLIQVLELNNAKAATPGRAVEIENFERLLKEILSAYIAVLN